MNAANKPLTTEEMMEAAIRTVQQMSPEEKAKLREQIKRSLRVEPVVITREGILKYWLSEPTIVSTEEFTFPGPPPFPDLAELSPEEKDLLRPVLQRNPDILRYEIFCGNVIQ